MGPLTRSNPPSPPDKLGGQALDLPADYHPDARAKSATSAGRSSTPSREAGVLDKLPYEPHRCGFMLGTTLHGMRAGGRFLRTGDHAPLGKFLAGSTLELAVAGLAVAGFAATTCSACSSSLGSIALGVTLLADRPARPGHRAAATTRSANTPTAGSTACASSPKARSARSRKNRQG